MAHLLLVHLSWDVLAPCTVRLKTLVGPDSLGGIEMRVSNSINIHSRPINPCDPKEELRVNLGPILSILAGCVLSLPLWVLIILALRAIFY